MDEREVKTVMKYIRMTPRKVRMIADLIRDKDVDEAETLLMFANRRATTPVRKALLTAINNAKQAKFDPDSLFVKKIFVDKGPTLKRFTPRARGIATRINKFTSHITIILGER